MGLKPVGEKNWVNKRKFNTVNFNQLSYREPKLRTWLLEDNMNSTSYCLLTDDSNTNKTKQADGRFYSTGQKRVFS